MKRGSPLKKCWTPGMDDGGSHYLIVIDDDAKSDNCFFNYIFEHIYDYTYEKAFENPIQHYFFWKNIRMYLEVKHREIMLDKCENMRRRLLSTNIYQYACLQELMFQKIESCWNGHLEC